MTDVLNLKTLHNRVSEGYFNVMRKYGFIQHQSEPLIPTVDSSILFTNSTIVPLKEKFLDGNYTGNGYFLLQNCLRLQTLKTIENADVRLKHVSCFKMLGTLVPKSNLGLAVDAMLEFLFNIVRISRNQLVVLIPSNAKFLEEIFLDKDISVQSSAFYEWKYGMKDVKGLGVALAVRLPNNSIARIGNFVAMYQEDKIMAYEFGFGIEPLVGKVMLSRTPFDGSIQFGVMGLTNNEVNHKIANLIGIVSAMSIAGVNKRQCRSRWFLLNQALRILILLAIRKNLKIEELISWINEFSTIFFEDTSNIRFISEQLTLRWRHISSGRSRFMNWLASQQSLYRNKGFGALKFSEKEQVLLYAEKEYFLEKEDAQELVVRFEPWK